MIALCKQGIFVLTKWLSNCKGVLDYIPEIDRAGGAKMSSLHEKL